VLHESHERLQNLVARLINNSATTAGVVERELKGEMAQALARLNTDLYWLNKLVGGGRETQRNVLADREREVLARLGTGERTGNIAGSLNLSEKHGANIPDANSRKTRPHDHGRSDSVRG
jgi:hypothetical protein